jgi:hypothetical protein
VKAREEREQCPAQREGEQHAVITFSCAPPNGIKTPKIPATNATNTQIPQQRRFRVFA